MLGVATYRCVLAAAAAIALHGAAQASVTVTPSDMQGWAFSNADNAGTTGTGQLVAGPGTPVLGNGSAQLTVGSLNSSEILYSLFGAGTKVSTLTTLAYSTYVTNSTLGSGSAPALSFDITYDNEQTYSGRLVFDPGVTGTVVDDEWQTWDTTTLNAWYFSRDPGKSDCTLNTGQTCTLAQIVSYFPNLTINDTVFKVGTNQSSLDANVDALQFGNAAGVTTVDFDVTAVPEPLSLSLLAAGVAAVTLTRRRGTPAPE
jgi:hypothetical protein